MSCLESPAARGVPVCVDLDGTLIRSNLLIESALSVMRHKPWRSPLILRWLMSGKARLKRELADQAVLDVSLLPYDESVLTWLREDCSDRERVLCTAADARLAEAVAEHLGLFDHVLASDGSTNLAGATKAAALCDCYGEGGFDYAGNDARDLHVWRHARRAIVVNASARLQASAARQAEVECVISPNVRGLSLMEWARALRPHQWLKNVLVFLPMLAAHEFFAGLVVLQSLLAFMAFSLCASSGYLLNDLLDLEADRHHPRKRRRPFAAGRLPLLAGLVVAPLLALTAFVIGYLVSPALLWVLLIYYLLTMAYSLWLKRLIMLDVMVLSALYTLRIFAGSMATGIPLSSWLLAFSMFLFLGLAMLKRYAELRGVSKSGGRHSRGRGYGVDDLPVIRSLGGTSSYMAVVVLALYINSTASDMLYRHVYLLWLLCPLLLYWQSRVWIIAHRNRMHDDPLMFAVKDVASWVVALLACAAVLGAI